MDFTHKSSYKDRPVTVRAGFDPVLHRFFTIVEADEDDHPYADPESGLIYSNLDDTDIPKESITVNCDYYAKKLKSMQIEVPDDFFRKVEVAND